MTLSGQCGWNRGTDSWWPGIVSLSPWIGAAACCVLGAFMLMDGRNDPTTAGGAVVTVTQEDKWVDITEVAEAEMLAAAADDLDSFSDQELASLVGF